MAKDPAFLFYPGDFMIGTALMNHEQRGKYVTLLCYQHQLGHLTKADMLSVCGSEDQKIFSKFEVDSAGLYYNKRLEEEKLKRSGWTQSRIDNLKGNKNKPHMAVHMENENRNEDKDINSNEGVFNKKDNFETAWAKYPVKDGKKAALRSFNASVNNQEEMDRLMKAMQNYLKSEKVLKGYVKNGSTWFGNWKDWDGYVPPKKDVLSENVITRMIEDELSQIATKFQVKKLMEKIPPELWWKIEEFLNKRYKGGGDSYSQALKEIEGQKKDIASLTSGIGKVV